MGERPGTVPFISKDDHQKRRIVSDRCLQMMNEEVSLVP